MNRTEMDWYSEQFKYCSDYAFKEGLSKIGELYYKLSFDVYSGEFRRYDLDKELEFFRTEILGMKRM